MAWITKNSGTMQIERRSDPYLTAQMKDELTNVYLPRYETTLAALLPALRMVQHEYAWIPFQAMEEIASFLKVSPSQVLDCASFYEEFWLKPRGKHIIAVCRSIACEICDHQRVTDAVREHLGIEVGETTDDDMFTLIEIECIGACGGAPSMLVDETLYENVTASQIPEIVAKAKQSGH